MHYSKGMPNLCLVVPYLFHPDWGFGCPWSWAAMHSVVRFWNHSSSRWFHEQRAWSPIIFASGVKRYQKNLMNIQKIHIHPRGPWAPHLTRLTRTIDRWSKFPIDSIVESLLLETQLFLEEMNEGTSYLNVTVIFDFLMEGNVIGRLEV